MQPVTAAQFVPEPTAAKPVLEDPVVIVGAGPVGMRAVGIYDPVNVGIGDRFEVVVLNDLVYSLDSLCSSGELPPAQQ